MDDSDETEEEKKEEEILGETCELIYTPPRFHDFQLHQKPNDDKSTGDQEIKEATEVTSEEAIEASDSEVNNDAVRSDKKKRRKNQ